MFLNNNFLFTYLKHFIFLLFRREKYALLDFLTKLSRYNGKYQSIQNIIKAILLDIMTVRKIVRIS